MSLNGLDGVAVAEAHQAALAEPGGWFLLRYASRDTVELLKKGSGGVQEARTVIQQYEEKSPLYGLVQYRRKKVILKYVPGGTSRLLQVRLTVQFQSVLETFTPHDTVFSFTLASELTESALGLCTMLLPSAASLTSSSSSLRRRRLDGITEDVEEPNAELPEDKAPGTAQSETPSIPIPTFASGRLEPPKEETTPTYGRHELDELPASAVLAKALLAKRKEDAAAAAAASGTDDSLCHDTPLPPRKDSLAVRGPPDPVPPTIEKALPVTPESTPPTTSEGEPPQPLDYETTNHILLESSAVDPSEPLTPRGPHTRHLSAAESDSISQWSSNVASYASVKSKKKKLGPRPHVESGHRPKTSGTSETSLNVRPVANLPNSIRVTNRSVVSLTLRPGSQQSTRSVPGRFPHSSHNTNFVPPLPSPSHLAPLYKQSESRPTISRPASVNTEGTTATPEKLRLMKALQLRKRNMLLAQRSSAGAFSSNLNASATNDQDSTAEAQPAINSLSSVPSQDQLSNIDEESKVTHSSSTTSPTFMTHISEEQSTKASSFTEPDDLSRKRRSLSSATSSSITPKAAVQDSVTQSEITNEDNLRGRPFSRPTKTLELGPPLEDTITAQGSPHEEHDLDSTTTCRANPSASEASTSDPFANGPPRIEPSPPSAPISEPPSKMRREAIPQPLKLASNMDSSASEVSDDESLMDELQHATVHEAMPVSVARSPVTPIMSKGSSDRLREIVNKTANSSYQARRSASTTPDRNRSGSIRSVSTALPQWPPAQSEAVPIPLTKKPTLGTGISRRIKALEVLTAKEANAQPSVPVRETTQSRSAFTTFMKRSSFLSTQPGPNTSTDNSPPKKLPETSIYDSNFAASTKDLRRPSSDANPPAPKSETISVTARIIRDPNNKHPPMSPSSSYATPLQLFRSPLIVEHEKHQDVGQEQSFASFQATTKSPTKSDKGGRFSFSSHRSVSQVNLPRSESSQSKMSRTNYKKHSARSVSDAGSFTEEKKSSRTSRLMKRVSNLTSSRKQSQSQPKESAHPTTIQEQREPTRQNSFAESLLHVVDIGDVNVQFPDSLLWKRRFMRVDDQGYLIFSPPMTDAHMKSISRKYHLSDFKKPSLPDLEREEMAWSILLDLKDGRCIQCACESRHARHQVLQSKPLIEIFTPQLIFDSAC
ncbi:uncharacterized protein A1O9_11021 [Exophiala aquamarina CBS 119918]|uniref:ADF-H domain-containing protein n=1 Tax=Exophiala aquamarina CBS 119918 TaxID=1182545 RepID=A0A072P1G4_9EURO|nr:uncharacterized protein A1O9_11021 [Exophiala aquamarina CBS 119918]KEF53113.1 hypothetical protein A1O9_11021 [Exophiala aquamarina CBS 119918]